MPADREHADMQRQMDKLTERMNDLEERADLDHALVMALKADGLLARQHSQQMEEAIRTSRRIGSAIGIVMAVRKVTEDNAFAILRLKSQLENRKLREVAYDVVLTGDVSSLPTDPG